MNRLTKYEPNDESMFPYKLKDEELSTKLDSIHKLGLLEDIEDELGIYLITLFNALKGIYIKDKERVYFVGSPYLCFAENSERQLEFQLRVGDIWHYIKDYGKTWALTKEELL